MPDIREAVYERLTSDAAITALVGNRVRPGILGQDDDYPAIRYETVSWVPPQDLRGSTSLVAVRVQIDVLALTIAEAATIADLVRNRFDGWSGTAAGLTIHRAKLVTVSDLTESGDTGSAQVVFRISTDYQFKIRKPAPVF